MNCRNTLRSLNYDRSSVIFVYVFSLQIAVILCDNTWRRLAPIFYSRRSIFFEENQNFLFWVWWLFAKKIRHFTNVPDIFMWSFVGSYHLSIFLKASFYFTVYRMTCIELWKALQVRSNANGLWMVQDSLCRKVENNLVYVWFFNFVLPVSSFFIGEKHCGFAKRLDTIVY